jgi:hypothetical protein
LKHQMLNTKEEHKRQNLPSKMALPLCSYSNSGV